MKVLQELSAFKGMNLKDLDLDTIASWPPIPKGILCLLLATLIIFLGYQFDLSAREDSLNHAIRVEEQLKQQLRIKVGKATNLAAYKEQLSNMEKKFSILVHQLPNDTEVPSLLEDITQIGLAAGLEFESITLQPEVSREFFIELPIQIKAVGKYHDIGNFISGVSSLKRIVTLHNFKIFPATSGELNLDILAKTYRYKDEGEDDG